METMFVNEKEFEVLRLLGKGKGGYSYLVTDGKAEYVLKQIHHEPCEYYQFGNKIQSEFQDYHKLKNIGIKMPDMLDIDMAKERILKEYIEGNTIYELVQKKQMKRLYVDQVREMCKILYAYQINIDYYPANFVVRNEILYYIDYECNEYAPEWDFENWGYQFWIEK